MAKIRVKRGLEANLPILLEGELAFSIDTKKLFIGTKTGNQLLINTADVSGDMFKGIYDTDNDGIVDWAEKVEWSGVQNKPTAYPPSAHNHSEIIFMDTRYSNSSPSDYGGRLKGQFKSISSIGITDNGTYAQVIGLRGWKDDSGGFAHELAFTDGGNIYYRKGKESTGWEEWSSLLRTKKGIMCNDLKGV